ncbi:hypothetical protein RND81_13G089700 [Saponaria officinalis]|uniref:Golgin candidate 2 n=1 Tax=Saponaria officinalis TaxID=3572 RepID=A0AAW1GXK9_SAPOF
MAGWISSKLKVAENLLQQIDQQAAESLGHGEKKPSDELDFTTSPKLSGSVSLKDQLKKKDAPKKSENFSKLGSDSSGIRFTAKNSVSDLKSPPSAVVNDTDWTELLSTPTQSIGQSSGAVSRRGVRRGGGVGGRGRKLGVVSDSVSSGNGGKAKAIIGGESSKLVEELGNVSIIDGSKDKGDESEDVVTRGKLVVKDDSQFRGSNRVSSSETDENLSPEVSTNEEYVGGETIIKSNRNADVSGDVKSNSHVGKDHESGLDSNSDSDSDSDSSSSSDSEAEREREERMHRRRQILAAKAAAKVAEAIKEQEDVVARLEGEKISLEKILEERAIQAQQEASELQSTMIETMEAADLEKLKHNHTRMEVLARLAKLETANADLAKSLANAQWNLETEVKNVAELRRLADAKELVHEELKKQIYNTHRTRTSLTSSMPYKGFEMEREMLEGEYSLITEKTALLQEKAMKLEGDIDVILKETESPSEVEVELKRRLRQMTDHLIQKQAQVEALSSEKATLLFRIEAVSKLLDENNSGTNGGYPCGSSREDVEGGTYDSTAGPKLLMIQHKIESGKQQLGSLVRQLDVVFSAGALFLARNPAAKLWSLVYLVCLHLWVLYILFSHSQPTENLISSSVVSLENINNSIGV